jgi:fatty-acid desaturase
MNLSWNFRIKFLQAVCYIGGPLVLIFDWNTAYFFAAWAWYWFSGHLGVSVGLHRCFSHRSWKPRNKFIECVIHFFAVISVVGSSITWTGTHRMHHRFSDTDRDPHGIENKDLWTRIRYWFNYWPNHTVELKYVKDLIRDPTHVWFHRHYFHILLSWMALLLLIDVDLFLYGFIVSTMMTLHTASWITVGAHIWGHNEHRVDSSKNTFFMGTYMWGEGWHSNHHAKPWSFEFGWDHSQPDLGKYIIRLIADPSSLQHAGQSAPRII